MKYFLANLQQSMMGFEQTMEWAKYEVQRLPKGETSERQDALQSLQYLDIWLGQMKQLNEGLAKKLAGFDESLPKDDDQVDFEKSVLTDLGRLDTLDPSVLTKDVPEIEDSDIWKK